MKLYDFLAECPVIYGGGACSVWFWGRIRLNPTSHDGLARMVREFTDRRREDILM
jgi:hypothetical protein